MNFHLNLQPLMSSRPDIAAKARAAKRPYRVTYAHDNGLYRITIKAVDRFAAHDQAKEATPAGMTLTGLREISQPVRCRNVKTAAA